VLTEARWGICGQHDQGLAESLQARHGVREPRMVAVHDPEVIRNDSRCRTEGADVLGDHHPLLRHGGLEHALVVDTAEARPVRR
jgi:hypothetical protein